MKNVPELGHTHSIQIKGQRIKEPGKFPRPTSSKIRYRSHNSKICILQLVQPLQIVCDNVPFGLTVSLNLQSNTIDGTTPTRQRDDDPVGLTVLKVTLPLKRPFRENLPIKLKWRNLF
jgi:hypothetical protein